MSARYSDSADRCTRMGVMAHKQTALRLDGHGTRTIRAGAVSAEVWEQIPRVAVILCAREVDNITS